MILYVIKPTAISLIPPLRGSRSCWPRILPECQPYGLSLCHAGGIISGKNAPDTAVGGIGGIGKVGVPTTLRKEFVALVTISPRNVDRCRQHDKGKAGPLN
jgi:hypothetical protein